MYAFGETWQSAMAVPVPVRKWLIRRWNKQKENEQKAGSNTPGSDTSKPMTDQERKQMIDRAQAMNTSPKPPSEFMTSRRNTP